MRYAIQLTRPLRANLKKPNSITSEHVQHSVRERRAHQRSCRGGKTLVDISWCDGSAPIACAAPPSRPNAVALPPRTAATLPRGSRGNFNGLLALTAVAFPPWFCVVSACSCPLRSYGSAAWCCCGGAARQGRTSSPRMNHGGALKNARAFLPAPYTARHSSSHDPLSAVRAFAGRNIPSKCRQP